MAFERWVAKRWGCANDKWADSGEYRYDDTRNWWQCWQAAISNTTPQSAPEDGEQSFIDEWESRFGFLATHNNPRSIESIDEVACLLITPPPASQERGGIKWPSSLGIAAIAREIWGNPIPPEAYAFAKRLHSAASPPSSAAAKEPEQRCPYCAGRIYSDAGCQNCKVGSVWPKPIAAEQDSSAAVGCNHQWVPDTEVEGVSYCAWCRVTRGDAAEQAKPDMAADDAFAAHIAKLDQDELEAEQAQAGELQGFPFGKAMEAAHKMKLEDTEFGSEEVDALHREWDRLPLRDTYAVSLFLDKTMALLRRLAGGMTVDDEMVERAARAAFDETCRQEGIADSDAAWSDADKDDDAEERKAEMKAIMRAALVAALGAK